MLGRQLGGGGPSGSQCRTGKIDWEGGRSGVKETVFGATRGFYAAVRMERRQIQKAFPSWTQETSEKVERKTKEGKE